MRRLLPSLLMIFASACAFAVEEAEGEHLVASKVAILGHPLHPVFVVFPLALFITALIFDVLSIRRRDDFWPRAAFYTMLVGLIGGIVAAVLGLAEYLVTVPDTGEVHESAELHGILMAVVMVVFAINLWIRWRGRTQPATTKLGLVLSVIGVAVMLVSGAIGGHMVYREGVGINLEEEEEEAPESEQGQIMRLPGPLEMFSVTPVPRWASHGSCPADREPRG